MRIKPALKTVSVSANGRFPPEAAIPEMLADMGILDRRTARQAVVSRQREDLAWFMAEDMTVEVLPGHLSVESSRPPYRIVRDVCSRLIRGLPDTCVRGLRFERTIQFPVRRLSDWHRMAEVLVAEFGWLPRGAGRIGATRLEPGKPAGGSFDVTACRSERLLEDGRTGIRIDLRDSYYGGDADGSTERLLSILRTEFTDAVSNSDTIVDRLMMLCASPRRRSMAA